VKQVVIIFLLVTAAVLCQAQDREAKNKKAGHPDFSGAWQLDTLKSELHPKLLVVSGLVVTLTVTHNDPELRIVQTTESREGPSQKEFVYRTDGAGETNPPVRSYQALFNGSQLSNRDPDKVPSTSEWHGKKLRTRSTVVIFIPDGKQSTVKTETVWEMSSDGDTLIQTISFTVERGEPIHFEPSKMKKVFYKVSTG
jgi:hypothetical protein